MGCGSSKLKTDFSNTPLLNPFRRKIEEIRQRTNGHTVLKDVTLCSKPLLKYEVEDGNNYNAQLGESRKSVSSPPRSYSTPGNDDKDKKNSPAPDKTERTLKKDTSTREGIKEGNVGVCGEKHGGDGGAEGFPDEIGHEITPGSPSFRVYFLSAEAISVIDAERDSSDAGNGEDRSFEPKNADKLLRTSNKNRSSSSEESIVKLEKKESKVKKFKNAYLQMGMQGGVRNFLHVRSCYDPSPPLTPTQGKVQA